MSPIAPNFNIKPADSCNNWNCCNKKVEVEEVQNPPQVPAPIQLPNQAQLTPQLETPPSVTITTNTITTTVEERHRHKKN